MKTKILLFTVLVLLVAPWSALADWHEFTSADGSQTLWAEVTGYDAESDSVSLLLSDKRRIQSPVSAFSEDDQEYIRKAALALGAGRNLAVVVEETETEVSEKRNPANGYRTVVTDNGFHVELRNNGQQVFTGLKAEYQIFYSAFPDPFGDAERVDQVTYGSKDIPDIEPREETKIETESVDTTSITRLPKSECAGGT